MKKLLHLLRGINRIADAIWGSALFRLVLVLVALFLFYRLEWHTHYELAGIDTSIHIGTGAIMETLESIERKIP